MAPYAWEPTPDRTEAANVTRLMRRFGASSIDDLRRRSVRDVDRFWDAVVDDLDIPFARPYSRVRDDARGAAWTTWFVDGALNATTVCLDRWRDDPAVADTVALRHEDESGSVRTLTFRELGDAVDRAAAGLRRLDIDKGDAVGVYLPMIPEAVIAAYAIAKVGALYVPLFSGFAESALASRLDDAQARVVVTTDWSWRRGRRVPMKPHLDGALALGGPVETVVVVERDDEPRDRTDGVDMTWDAFAPPVEGPVTAAETAAEDPLLLGYTSGTAGAPKGAVHTHAGFVVKVASEVAYAFDVRRGDTFFWVTDMGWIMGPLGMFGAHALGASLLLYEGSADTPGPERLWEVVERHRATVLGLSPTLIRTLKVHGDDPPKMHDLSSVAVFGSTGEPWDADAYRWLADHVGGGRVPIINFSGGTEVGGSFLSCYVVEPLSPCSLGGPSLGMDVDVLDEAGRPVRGELGELVCRQAWPSMTRGVWGDPERYDRSYWSTYPGIWHHGDWAKVGVDGQWYLFGRSDEAISVAGKRIGPAEVEGILAADPAVAEAAVIGVPEPRKGEAVWCFWIPADPDGPDVSDDLAAAVERELGRPFAPARVLRVLELPRTSSAKLMRRAIRAVAAGDDPGDLSAAQNPDAIDAIRLATQVPPGPLEDVGAGFRAGLVTRSPSA
ncbi:MAG: AMP-binding protein [Solirubrobacteraceae bacterium]|nr:AMP-binding protein [Solirubrobacteraceae bacterium]